MSFAPSPPDMSNPRPGRQLQWGAGALLVFGVAVYLISNHWLHILDALPYLLAPAFMLLCMFGHGHGSHGGHAPTNEKEGEQHVG